MQKAFSRFDFWILAAVNGLPRELKPLMEFASLIGQPVLVGVLLGALGIAAYMRGARTLAWASAASIAGLLISMVFKLIFHRTRPSTYLPSFGQSYSFPSGHAASAVIGFGLFAWLAAKHLPQPWGAIVSATLVALIFLIGLSRVYLGAHYPTDVLGGWILGTIILIAVIKIFKI